MIELAHPPIVQDIIDRWRSQLPIPVQIDGSLLAKEHLRSLVQMLMAEIDSEHQSTDNQLNESTCGLVERHRRTTVNGQLPSSVFSTSRSTILSEVVDLSGAFDRLRSASQPERASVPGLRSSSQPDLTSDIGPLTSPKDVNT